MSINLTAAAQVLSRRIKNRRLPSLNVPQTGQPELDRALKDISEHLRMYEGGSGAPKQRFVTIEDLEQSGLISITERQGFAAITKVLGSDPPKAVSTAPSRQVVLSIDSQNINNLDGIGNVDTGAKKTDDFLHWNGTSWVPLSLYNTQNTWKGRQQFKEGVLELFEKANGDEPSAQTGRGYIYVEAGQTLYFRDEGGTDYDLTAAAAATTLTALTDTDITSPADGAFLIYDTGTATWRDFLLSGDVTVDDSGVATVANDSHTHVIANITDFTDNSTNWDTAFGWGDHAGLYLANVVEDTTPELGGNLALGGFTINGIGGINFAGDIEHESSGTTHVAHKLYHVTAGGMAMEVEDAAGIMRLYQTDSAGNLEDILFEANRNSTTALFWNGSQRFFTDQGGCGTNSGFFFVGSSTYAYTPGAGSGVIWLDSDTDTLYFRNDSGTDFDLNGGLANVVEDLSPQLGANLDTNGFHILQPDGDNIIWGTGFDASMSFDGTQMNFALAASGTVWAFRDASDVRFYDSTDTDYLSIKHNGTDVDFTHATTGDWNITGITAINAGTVDADFDAITATSYGGITEANLLDKSATETVSGAWEHSATLSMSAQLAMISGNEIRLLNPANTQWVDIDVDATSDLNIASTSVVDINITGITAINAGTVDADFDAITATSYGGITEANLLDKSAAETVSGAWTFSVPPTVDALFMTEQAAADADVGASGQWWVKDDVTSAARFTDDAGFDNLVTSHMEWEFSYNTTVAVADPGTGQIGGNHVTWASMTGLRFNDVDTLGHNVEWWLGALAENDMITLVSTSDAANYLLCRVTAAATDQTGYWSVPIAIVASGTEPANTEQLRISIDWVGSAGFAELLPVGTTTGATLYWDGADWIENSKIRNGGTGILDIYDNAESNYMRLFHGGGVVATIDFDTLTTIMSIGTGSTAFEKLRVGTGGSGALSIELEETATGPTAVVAHGNIWVKTATPNELWFRDDAGTDIQLGVTATERSNWDTAFGWGDHSGTLYEPYDLAIVKSDEAETISAAWTHTASLTMDAQLAIDNGNALRLLNPATTQWVDFSVDATSDLNIASTSVTDLNITGFTAINAGTVDADFDAITGTSYGGITEANLVDKSVIEVIGSQWYFDNGIQLRSVAQTENVTLSHDGTDLNITGNVTTDINLTGITALQAGTVDADFDAITGTSYGGITEANLVDKSATEAITGTWTLDGSVTESDFGTGGKVKDGTDVARPIGFNVMPVYEIDVADSFDLAHVGMIWNKDAGGTISFTCDNDATIPQGATYVVHNQDTEDLTIAQGAGVTVYWIEGGSAPAAGAVTVSQGGIVTVYKYSDTEFWCWGAKDASTGISNLVEDLSPQLGATLLSNAFDITMADNDRVHFGTAGASDSSIWFDATDLNIDGTGATDLNILNFTAIAAGTVDADFDAITATSYGGITEANLVDKSANEVVSGEWTVPAIARNKAASYTMVLGDAGQLVRFTGATASKICTIPANASVAFPIGTMIGVTNDGSVTMTLAITTDTLTWGKDNTTGTRTLAAGADCVILKTTATTWKVNGSALVT